MRNFTNFSARAAGSSGLFVLLLGWPATIFAQAGQLGGPNHPNPPPAHDGYANLLQTYEGDHLSDAGSKNKEDKNQADAAPSQAKNETPAGDHAATIKSTAPSGLNKLGLTLSNDAGERVVVRAVAANSPAAKAGLQPRDQVVSVNGQRVTSAAQFDVVLHQQVSRFARDEELAFEIRRGGMSQTLYCNSSTFAAAGYDIPAASDGAGSTATNGVTSKPTVAKPAQPPAPESRTAMRAPSQNQTQNQVPPQSSANADRVPEQRSSGHSAYLGVELDQNFSRAAVIAQVIPGSVADQAGLRRGDTIWNLNGTRVGSSQELHKLIAGMQPGQAIQIHFSRPVARNVQLSLGDRAAPHTVRKPAVTTTKTSDRESNSSNDKSINSGSINNDNNTSDSFDRHLRALQQQVDASQSQGQGTASPEQPSTGQDVR